MKNNQKGFVIPLSIAIVALLGIGGGAYVYVNKEKNNTPAQIDANVVGDISTSTTTKSKKVSTTTTEGKPSIVTSKSILIAPKTDILNGEITKCTDTKCFIEAIKNCVPANYQADSKTEYLGSNIEGRMSLGLTKTGDNCLLNINLISYNISASQGLIDSMKGAQMMGPGLEEIYLKLNKQMQDKYIGKNGSCVINTYKDTVISLFDKNAQVLLVSMPEYDICSGDLFVKFDTQ